MAKIQAKIEKFQPVDILQIVLVELNNNLASARAYMQTAQQQLLNQSRKQLGQGSQASSTSTNTMTYPNSIPTQSRQKKFTKKTPKKNDEPWDLEAQLRSLDFMENKAVPEPVNYRKQLPPPQTNSNTKPGDMITYTNFGHGNVLPTPVGKYNGGGGNNENNGNNGNQ